MPWNALELSCTLQANLKLQKLMMLLDKKLFVPSGQILYK